LHASPDLLVAACLDQDGTQHAGPAAHEDILIERDEPGCQSVHRQVPAALTAWRL
jgi:hypothetical protein